MNEALIESLTKRALAGDIQAADLVLKQPRRINARPADDEFTARACYLGVWDALSSGKITVPEARDLLEILGKVERFL